MGCGCGSGTKGAARGLDAMETEADALAGKVAKPKTAAVLDVKQQQKQNQTPKTEPAPEATTAGEKTKVSNAAPPAQPLPEEIKQAEKQNEVKDEVRAEPQDKPCVQSVVQAPEQREGQGEPPKEEIQKPQQNNSNDEAREKMIRLGQQQQEQLRVMFAQADYSKNGKLNLSELAVLLQKAGYFLPQQRQKLLFRILDTQGDGQLQFPEFLRLAYILENTTDKDTDKMFFLASDIDQSGCVNRTELQRVMKLCGHYPNFDYSRLPETDIGFEEYRRVVSGQK